MLRNYIAAAFGNLSRNWFYAGVTILGLAVSFAAAMLIGLYLRDEVSFDRFVLGYHRIYRLETDLTWPGGKPIRMDASAGVVAGQLRLNFPQLESVARISPGSVGLRRGDVESLEQIVWADPDFFRILQAPVLAGDPTAALAAPDGLVLTHELARKYFGEDAPIGKTLRVTTGLNLHLPAALQKDWVAPHVMRVLAVLKDPPGSSHIKAGVYGSGRAALSLLVLADKQPSIFNPSTLTYVKLKPAASPDAVRAGLPAFTARRFPAAKALKLKFRLEPLAGLHFTARQGGDALRPPGDRAVDAGIGAAGLLIIMIAAINFVTLMTARSTRRAVEVGVRKAVGARRRDLVVQFMGEAALYVLIAMLIGVSVAELLLPYANALVGRSMRFDYLADPRLLAAIVVLAALTILLAGAYPALVISGFRPASALKGGVGIQVSSGTVRHALVMVQFAILIGLVVVSGTIYRQTTFALNDAMRMDTDQILRIGAPCETALKQQISALPGVSRVACAGGEAVGGGTTAFFASRQGHALTPMDLGPVDLGFFEMHGLKPLAGRFFDRNRGQDMVLELAGEGAANQPAVVLNQTAALRLGFTSPQDAVGKTVSWARFTAASGFGVPPMAPSQVIGVVPDFTLKSIRGQIDPTLYYVDLAGAQFMVAKLDGHQLRETLRAIDQVWKTTGHDRPLPHAFENQVVQDLYRDVIVQEIAVGICAGLAILIACVGLFALAAFTTERRTKEIGVRKAMGASTFDVVRLLLWQFTKPVLWANLVAWPLAFWAMDHWLHGFAYRVDLPPWLFAAASVVAVLIAWITVSTHAWLVARAKPATALRYE